MTGYFLDDLRILSFFNGSKLTIFCVTAEKALYFCLVTTKINIIIDWAYLEYS